MPDTTVRESAVQTLQRIADKVQDKAVHALHDPVTPDDVGDYEDYATDSGYYKAIAEFRLTQLEEALKYATSALRAVETAINMGQGGVVLEDGPTSLYFQGFLTGAAIDRDTHFSTHT